jgi:hypothetical protein
VEIAMSTTTALHIDMGKGLALDLTDEGEGRWKLAFDTSAPALDHIEVQAIGGNGQCHPMKMFPGPDRSSVYASGPVEKAYRVRVVVNHGDHTHRRDLRLPGTPDYKVTKGTHGGTLISMGHDSFVELLPQGDRRWKLTFLEKEALTRVPAVADVVAEAIAGPADEDQVRKLAVLPGDDQHSLFLEGKVGDAEYLRLAVMMGDHYHTRCVPVTRP